MRVILEVRGSHTGADKLDSGCTILSGSVKCVVTSKQWVTALKIADLNYQVWLICHFGYKTCGWQVKLCDAIKHRPFMGATETILCRGVMQMH
jgi:hypothetical protein